MHKYFRYIVSGWVIVKWRQCGLSDMVMVVGKVVRSTLDGLAKLIASLGVEPSSSLPCVSFGDDMTGAAPLSSVWQR